MNSQSDRIVEAIRNKKKWALNQVSERITPIVRSQVYSFRNWEDVRQKCLMAIFQAVERTAKIENIWGFVRQIAVTKVIDENRKEERDRARHAERQEGRDSETGDYMDRFSSRIPSPDAALENLDLFLYIYQRIGNACRKIIDLVFLDGDKYEDVAEQLGISEKNLRVRIHRCKKRARQIRSEAMSL